MFGRVFVLRGIATAHLPAFQAQPQMDPAVSHFYALFANMGVSAGESNLIEMSAFRHAFLLMIVSK
jgi:hypothetical protein